VHVKLHTVKLLPEQCIWRFIRRYVITKQQIRVCTFPYHKLKLPVCKECFIYIYDAFNNPFPVFFSNQNIRIPDIVVGKSRSAAFIEYCAAAPVAVDNSSNIRSADLSLLHCSCYRLR